MVRWEYIVVEAGTLGGWNVIYPDRKEKFKGSLTEILNSLGASGWEAAFVILSSIGENVNIVLKRPSSR